MSADEVSVVKYGHYVYIVRAGNRVAAHFYCSHHADEATAERHANAYADTLRAPQDTDREIDR